MISYIKNKIKHLIQKTCNLFLHGLFTILPLAITIGFFYMILEIMKKWLAPIQCFQPAFLKVIPYSELILALLIVILIGSILKTFIVKSLMAGLEAIMFKMPLIKPIYSGVKQLIHALNPQPNEKDTFTKVVMIEFPLKGAYSIGFMTTEVTAPLSPDSTKKFFNIFVPTTPNPTTGYFVMVAEQDIMLTLLTRQEAMGMIISGGIIQPQRFNPEKATPN